MDRTCLRPLNTDDIISKELPSEILDTDFAEKDEDVGSPVESLLSDIPSSENAEQITKNEDNVDRQSENSRDDVFQADILEQDTGYSSDAGENVKSVTSEMVDPIESKREEKAETCRVTDGNLESATGEGMQVIDNTTVVSNTDIRASLPAEENTSDSSPNGFVPTIVGIRGACDSKISNQTLLPSDLEKAESSDTSSNTTLQNINIVNVQGSCEKLPKSCDEENSADVVIVDDSMYADNSDPTSSYNSDLNIKEEPPESVDNDDCMYVNAEHADTCFTSEIFIEEDKSHDNEKEDEEIVCIESSGKIPLPIPIKTEGNVESEEKLRITKLQSQAKESKNANLPVVQDTPLFSTVGYTCHLCNMTFQEHERLNDHMMLHRNNLVNANTINKMKQKTLKPTCPVCKKQLSTLHSLQQHVLIHNNEKPYQCKTCGKDFRHQPNYKTHMQKHEAEKMKGRPRVERQIAPAPGPASSSRSIDLGKLIGPFYARETLINLGTRTNQQRPLLPTPSTFRRDNAKENVNVLRKSSADAATRTRAVHNVDDDVIPLKTFSKVENIVMNAARFIVKVDSIDPNVLKRRIKTPDISIDRQSTSGGRRFGEKRKIVLSPSDKNKRLKLDQIENIIIDGDADSDVQTQSDTKYKDDDLDYDYDVGDDDSGSDSPEPVKPPVPVKLPESVRNNDLFELLNHNRASGSRIKTHNDYVSELRRNAQMILKSEAEKSKNSRPPKSSNVIMLKCLHSSKPAPSPTTHSRHNELTSLATSETPYESYSSENSDDEAPPSDSFDAVFQRVALRRLLLIQKRAAKNNGKIDSRYLLGPRFWRKALRRAKLKPIDFDASNFSDAIPAPSTPPVKMDERRTNDPKALQIRAENKLSCMLEKVRSTSSMNRMNLIGPLFWKRTLQLAGVHYPRDLAALLSKERLSLRDVEFVEDAPTSIEQKKEPPPDTTTKRSQGESKNSPSIHTGSQMKEKKANHSLGNSPLLPVDSSKIKQKSNDSLNDCDSNNRSNKLVDSILSDVIVPACLNQSSKTDAAAESADSNDLAKNNSILYDSLTRPRDLPIKPANSDFVPDAAAPVAANNEKNVEDVTGKKNLASVVVPDGDSTGLVAGTEMCETKPEELNASDTQAAEMNANIVLNVDENFQLIASDSDKLAHLADGSNYVLVSDETGAMQLVKENDLRLVEGNDASGEAQYVVNLQGENFPNVDLTGQVNGEQQLTYALQFDGENYTAIQFVQDDSTAEEVPKSEGEAEGANVILKHAEAGQTAGFILPTVATDLNSIGKELSDFLNLNYATLTKNENNDL